MRHGITYPSFSDVLKNVYLDLAEREVARTGASVSDSRISLLTGVHRKYVRTLRHEARAALSRPMPRQVSLSAQIAAVWNGGAEFVDAQGEPRPLPRQSASPEEVSFETLVRSVSRDIHPRVVLDEWIRVGAVRIDTDGLVRLTRSVFAPVADFEQQSHYLAQNVHDHLAAIEHNMSGAGSSFLERCVHYGNLRPEACADLSALAEKAGMQALRKVNDRVIGSEAGARPGEGGWRVNFGVYFYAEPETLHPDPAPESPAEPGTPSDEDA
jgi:hypothetical protein